MREISKYTETIEKEDVVSITCDKCGKTEEGKYIEYSSDIQTQIFAFGYGSSQDGDTIKMDLCTSCIMEWVDTFVHKPDIKSSF